MWQPPYCGCQQGCWVKCRILYSKTQWSITWSQFAKQHTEAEVREQIEWGPSVVCWCRLRHTDPCKSERLAWAGDPITKNKPKSGPTQGQKCPAGHDASQAPRPLWWWISAQMTALIVRREGGSQSQCSWGVLPWPGGAAQTVAALAKTDLESGRQQSQETSRAVGPGDQLRREVCREKRRSKAADGVAEVLV